MPGPGDSRTGLAPIVSASKMKEDSSDRQRTVCCPVGPMAACSEGTRLASASTLSTLIVPKEELARDDAALIAVGTAPQFREWLAAMEGISGCASPVYLVGHTITRDAATGEVLHVFSSDSQPRGRLAVACGNRRATRCAPCAWLHAGDTYQLVVSGLAGGKGVPATVTDHPRVFVTLTAPSFGAVHRVSLDAPCRPRRDGGRCVHGVPVGCPVRHRAGDPVIGWPLCADCYDYAQAVLWNAHAGALWDDFAKRLRRALASRLGVSRTRLREHLRVSFAKVAEYQRRGAVHLHAVVRLDGPDGPGADEAAGLPPDWVTRAVLEAAVRSAAGSALVTTADPAGSGVLVLRFGAQMDVQPVEAVAAAGVVTDGMVAGYVAKYVTKGHIPGLVLDTPLPTAGHIGSATLSDHGRALMHAVWELGGRPEYEGLRLRNWAHQLGFRGHIATKSRLYSTTYTALRGERAAWRRTAAGEPTFDDRPTQTVSKWRFVDAGHSPGEALYAAGVALAIQGRREAAQEARNDKRGVTPRG